MSAHNAARSRLDLWLRPTAAGGAPQQQQRASDLAAGGEILLVHREIDAVGRAIVLAHGVDGRRIAEAALVFGERLLAEEAQSLLGLGRASSQ